MNPLDGIDSGELPTGSGKQAPVIECRQIESDGMSWHLCESGAGPEVLLLHGTGSSSHTWNALLPNLAGSCRLLMPDLPGHARSGLPRGQRLTLDTMSRGLAALLDTLAAKPVFAIGHSAGAAVLSRMTLDRCLAPRAIVSLNGAFLPFAGATSHLFEPLARVLSATPLVPRLASWRLANRRAVERLVAQVGSMLTAEQLDDYVDLLRSPRHIGAALEMMANWDLSELARRMPELGVPLELIACERDRAVPPAQARGLAAKLPVARLHSLAGVGHLGHEEDPARVAALLRQIAREVDIEL